MNVGLVQAVTLGLLRCGALGSGVWIVAHDHAALLDPVKAGISATLIGFATGASIYDKFAVNSKVQSALNTEPPKE